MRKVTILMVLSFLFVQATALIIGSQFIALDLSVVDNPADPANAGFFFAYVLFSAIVLLIVLKFYHGNLLFVALEFVLLLFSLDILFSLALEGWFSLALAAVITLARFKYPQIRSFLLLISSAVVGAMLGSSLDILPALIFSALLAGYDVVAVFYTKHMVTLAQGLSQRGAAFSIQIRANEEKRTVATPEQRQARKELSAAKGDSAYKKGLKTKTTAPTEPEFEAIELGTGDLVIPAMLLVSALKVSLPHAILAFAGSVLGIIGLFYVLERQRGYWPALPPLVFGAVLGLAIAQALAVLKVF